MGNGKPLQKIILLSNLFSATKPAGLRRPRDYYIHERFVPGKEALLLSLDQTPRFRPMSAPRQTEPSTALLCVGSAHYIHYARVLVPSVKEFHPDWPAYFCCVDQPPAESLVPGAEPFEILDTPWLRGEEGRRYCFQYAAMELVGMSRSRALTALLDRGYTRVIYLDLDMRVYAPLTPLLEALERAAIVMTPHLTEPLPDSEAAASYETLCKQSGLVNSACLAVREHPQARAFLTYWASRTERHGHIDAASGHYSEQSWMDYALAFYDQAALLRHPGFNVAVWNLPSRPITREPGGAWSAGGQPLVCFHWSGLRWRKPDHIYNHPIAPGTPLADLAAEYSRDLAEAGAPASAQKEYGHLRLSDGTRIERAWREAVRQRLPGLEIPADPFAATPEWKQRLRAVTPTLSDARADWVLDRHRRVSHGCVHYSYYAAIWRGFRGFADWLLRADHQFRLWFLRRGIDLFPHADRRQKNESTPTP